LTEYVDKMLKRRGPACLRHHRGKIAAVASCQDGGASKPEKEHWNNALAPYGTALSPERQTRYELKSSFGRAVS
jgi:hypothetical protein